MIPHAASFDSYWEGDPRLLGRHHIVAQQELRPPESTISL